MKEQKLSKKGLTDYKIPSIIYNCKNEVSGNYGLKVTPVPIPNTMVKLQSAEGTALETVWKSRSLPGNGSLAQLVRATGS